MSKSHSLTIKDERQLSDMMPSIKSLGLNGLSKGPFILTFSRPKRSNPQNALMWKLLGQVSKQVEWYGQKLSSEDWKHVLSASLTGQRSIPGIDGGFVVLGVSTSKQSKEWLSNMIELIYAFGSQSGVKFETNEY